MLIFATEVQRRIVKTEETETFYLCLQFKFTKGAFGKRSVTLMENDIFCFPECREIYRDLLVYQPGMYVTVSFLSPLSFFCKESYVYDIAMFVRWYVHV